MPWGSALHNEFCTSKLKKALNVYASILISSSSSDSRPVLHTDKAAPIWYIKPACSTKDNSTRSGMISSRFPLQPTNKEKVLSGGNYVQLQSTLGVLHAAQLPQIVVLISSVSAVSRLWIKCVIRSADAFESSQRGWAHIEPSTWGGLSTPPLQSWNE